MRKFTLGLILVISLLLQLTVFNFIKVAGVKPDLILVFVIFNALLNGSRDGAVFGLVGGLLQDLITGQFIGLNAISKALTGFLFGLMGKKLYKENIIIPIISLFLGSIFCDFVIYILGYFISLNTSLLMVFKGKILPAAIYNACLTPFIYGKFYDSSAKGLLSKVK